MRKIALRELSTANGLPVRIKQRAMPAAGYAYALRLNAHGWNVPRIAE